MASQVVSCQFHSFSHESGFDWLVSLLRFAFKRFDRLVLTVVFCFKRIDGLVYGLVSEKLISLYI